MKKLRFVDIQSRRSCITRAAGVALRALSGAGLALLVLLHLANPGLGAELVLIGTHPTSTLTAYPTIHTLKAYQGRIYLGYGDWNLFPAVTVASYDPVEHAFRLEFSPNTDSIGIFREVGGQLFIPSIDPVLYGHPSDYSYCSGGVWRDSSPANMLHVLDIGTVNGTDLWLVGSKEANETATYNHAVFRSADGGRTWQDLTLQSPLTDSRYYYGFALRGKFYVRDAVYDGTNGTRITAGPYRHVNKATAMGTGANEFILGVTGWVKGIGAPSTANLVTYDTATWRTLRSGVYDFTIVGTNVYTLELNSGVNRLWLGFNVSASSSAWQWINFANVPSNAKCIEVLNDVLYVGDASGRLWAGSLNGSAMATNAPVVVNEMTDAFGTAMSIDGATLAVGAPDHSDQAPLCGRVSVWEAPGGMTGNGEWRRTATIDPPAPSFSGWFGNCVTLKDNLLAVVQAGRDLSGADRGSAAQVHLYEREGEAWLSREQVTQPYAQVAAIDSGWLAVGAGGVNFGTNFLNLYRIEGGVNGAELTLHTNFAVLAPGFWRPAARVALAGDICAFGSVGDAAFSGGPGEVQVYQRDQADIWHLRQTLHSTSAIPTGLTLPPDRFGLALALGGGWLVVGAPCDDTSERQAGAVHLFERTNSPTGEASFVLRQAIYSPVPQAAAGFGNSVALSGSTLMVGAPGAELGSERHKGKVFIFKRGAGAWQQVAEITRPSGSEGEFGTAVALGANWLGAGSRFAGSSSNVTDRITVWPFGPLEGELSPLRQIGPGSFELAVRGEIGRTYSLQTATELPGGNWTNLLEFTLTTPATNVLAPDSSAPQRFYKLASEADAP